MKRATGIGGIFFKTKDPKAMKAWYNRHLGVPIPNPYSGLFEWREKDNPDRIGYTVWSPFDKDTDYFGEGEQTFMINYRVENLAELLEVLKQEGIKVVKGNGRTRVWEICLDTRPRRQPDRVVGAY